MEESPDQRDKGAVEGKGDRVGPRGGVWWKSKVQYRTERKRSAEEASCPEGELAGSSEPKSIGAGGRTGDGVGTKLCVLTWRDLSASAHGR
jgi:hypothetical protein